MLCAWYESRNNTQNYTYWPYHDTGGLVAVLLPRRARSHSRASPRQKQVKGKVHPRTSHEDPDGEWRYGYTRSLTSATDGTCGQRHVPAAVPPGKRPGTHCTGIWVGPRASRDGTESFATPGRQPAVSRSTDCAIPVHPCEIYSEGSGTGSGSSPPYFGLSVSVLFHQCSIFILILPLSCVQEEKAWEYSKFFQISGSTGQKTNNSEHQHHLITFRRCGAIY